MRNVAAVVDDRRRATGAIVRRRLMNSTSYLYFHTDQWRYDCMNLDPIRVPWAKEMPR